MLLPLYDVHIKQYVVIQSGTDHTTLDARLWTVGS